MSAAMSKPISFGFGKQKPSAPTPTRGAAPRQPGGATNKSSRAALRHDSDNEEEEEPRHESVTGFSSGGAILSQPVQATNDLIIKNSGNADWRRRGRKDLLPPEVRAAQQQNGGVVMVERDEVSKASGLQYAEKHDGEETAQKYNGEPPQQNPPETPGTPPKQLTEDEEALQALLDDGSGKPKSNAVIFQQGNTQLSSFRDEAQEFKEDVASRPDSCTLEEYAAMPVEEFGMAMLRGMGQKRRANGEVIDLNPKTDENAKKQRRQEGFLGVGAKSAPGIGVELGAWGKADMRKNDRGQGFFTPLMRENAKTGERITEEELQKRIKESKAPKKDEEDWRQRRDRNLEHSGRDRDRDRDRDRKGRTNGHDEDDHYRDQMNAFSRSSDSTKGDRDREDREHSRSQRRDRDDRDYDSSRSRREDDERSKDRRRRDDADYDKGRHRDRHRDEGRYDSSSSHRSHRDRDKDRDRHRDRERDSDRRHRDR